jgi:hypothetical protein
MIGILRQRLARLEATGSLPARERIVWVHEGEPMPVAAPGERLTIVRWICNSDAGHTDEAAGAARP